MTVTLRRASIAVLALAAMVLAAVALNADRARGDSLTAYGLNGRIAFASDREGNTLGRFAEGRGPVPFGFNRSESCDAFFNGDGPIGDHECAFDVFTMNPDGSDVKNLTGGQIGGRNSLDDEPSWSPDGTKIAFASRRDCNDDASPGEPPCTTDIWVMNSDGSGPHQLTDACHDQSQDPDVDHCRRDGDHDSHPTWSPDGNTIAFSRSGLRNFDFNIVGKIYTIPATGSPGQETEVPTGTANNFSEEDFNYSSSGLPYWAPDGQTIYFTRLHAELNFIADARAPEGAIGLDSEDQVRKLVDDTGLFSSRMLDEAFARVKARAESSRQELGPPVIPVLGFYVHNYRVSLRDGSIDEVGGPPDFCEAAPIPPFFFPCHFQLNPALTHLGDRVAIQETKSNTLDQIFKVSTEDLAGGRGVADPEELFLLFDDTDIVTFNASDGSDRKTIEAGDPSVDIKTLHFDCGFESKVGPCFGDYNPAYAPENNRIAFHSDRIDLEGDTIDARGLVGHNVGCEPYFQQYAYAFFFPFNCQSRIYTMGTDGAAISGPLGQGPDTAPPSDEPIVDRNPDWQRVQPPTAAGCTDNAGPSVTITSNQHRSTYKKKATASVNVSASDPSGLKVDPSNPSLPISTSKTGHHTLSLTATDNCNNSTTETFSYVVADDPVITVAGVSAACTVSGFRAGIRLSSPARMRRVDVLLDGKRLKRTKKKRFNVQVSTSKLKSGRHTLTVRARDRAGNLTVKRFRFRRCARVRPLFTG